VNVRPFRAEDEAAVLDLLHAALGPGPIGERTPDFFSWKHRRSPFGRSLMLVAEDDGRVVGLRAFLRWRFRAGERTVAAVRAVDTATHPGYRRRGVFSRLTTEALEALDGEAEFVFNTPNPSSLPGYLKLGWRKVGRVPVRVRAGHFWRRSMSAPPAAAVLDESLAPLLNRTSPPNGRLATPRNLDYLRWRYASAPRLDYRAVREEGGLAVFRVRRRGRLREAAIAELLAVDREVERRLVRAVARAAPVGHLAFSGRRLPGFLRVPRGPTLVVRPLGDVDPDPARPGSWALSLGDLEVM
jgi:GNAT superfamily N-acetyltransferase